MTSTRTAIEESQHTFPTFYGDVLVKAYRYADGQVICKVDQDAIPDSLYYGMFDSTSWAHGIFPLQEHAKRHLREYLGVLELPADQDPRTAPRIRHMHKILSDKFYSTPKGARIFEYVDNAYEAEDEAVFYGGSDEDRIKDYELYLVEIGHEEV